MAAVQHGLLNLRQVLRQPPVTHSCSRGPVRARPTSAAAGSSTRVRFMPDNNANSAQQADPAATSPGKGQRASPVEMEQHWTTLLTTMPGLDSYTWSGRVGQYVLHSGPSTAPDALSEQGAVLHLWRSTSEPPEAAAASETHSAAAAQQLPDSVAVSYFTAPGAAVAAPAGPPGGGSSSSSATFIWDQQQLAARPTSFEFSPAAPQLSLTLASPAGGQSVPLQRSLRLLPLSSSGVAVINAALPPAFGPDSEIQANWFFEILLTHPDAAGDWQASTLGVAYDWATGKLHSHKFLWQKATTAVEAPPEDLRSITVTAVSPPQRNGAASLSETALQLSELSELHTALQHHCTTYCYSSEDGQQQLMRADHHQQDAAAGTSRSIGGSSSAGSSVALQLAAVTADLELSSEVGADAAEAPDGGRVTLWFPQGGVYARVPAQLPGAVPANGGEVCFEVGAIHGDAVGLSRCVLTYPTDGDRRIKQVLNDSWTLVEQDAAAAATGLRDRTATRTAPGLI